MTGMEIVLLVLVGLSFAAGYAVSLSRSQPDLNRFFAQFQEMVEAERKETQKFANMFMACAAPQEYQAYRMAGGQVMEVPAGATPVPDHSGNGQALPDFESRLGYMKATEEMRDLVRRQEDEATSGHPSAALGHDRTIE